VELETMSATSPCAVQIRPRAADAAKICQRPCRTGSAGERGGGWARTLTERRPGRAWLSRSLSDCVGSRGEGGRDVGPRPLRLAIAEARRGPHRALARRHHRCSREEGGDTADGTATASASCSPATGREEEGQRLWCSMPASRSLREERTDERESQLQMIF
jgi:hypothetical protein